VNSDGQQERLLICEDKTRAFTLTLSLHITHGMSSLRKKSVSANSEAEMQTRKNFKFGSSLRFGPVRQGQNTFFPETNFFQGLDVY
jgi:hypothetical protein